MLSPEQAEEYNKMVEFNQKEILRQHKFRKHFTYFVAIFCCFIVPIIYGCFWLTTVYFAPHSIYKPDSYYDRIQNLGLFVVLPIVIGIVGILHTIHRYS